jgi:hypothetical protein
VLGEGEEGGGVAVIFFGFPGLENKEEVGWGRVWWEQHGDGRKRRVLFLFLYVYV